MTTNPTATVADTLSELASRSIRDMRMVAQVALGAVTEDPRSFDVETIRVVRENAVIFGVAKLYMDVHDNAVSDAGIVL